MRGGRSHQVSCLCIDSTQRYNAKVRSPKVNVCGMKKVLTISIMILLSAAPALQAKIKLVRRGGKWVRQSPAVRGTASGEVEIIRQYIARKKYRAAIKEAKRFLKRYPASPLKEEVYYLAGEANLARGHYWAGYEWFERLLSQFPSGEFSDRALDKEIEIARAFLAGKKRRLWKIFRIPAKQDGIDILERICQRFPQSPHAEIATLMIAEHYANSGRWSLAAERYDEFLRLYPRSPHVKEVELLAADALYHSYSGHLRDETPLIEAEQRYKNFIARYPKDRHVEMIRKRLFQIRSARAERLYITAKFYRRIHKDKAAAYYFRKTLEEYPHTPWARKARAELAKISRENGSDKK